jgi:endonuclease-3
MSGSGDRDTWRAALLRTLRQFAASLTPQDLLPACSAEASRFAMTHAYAFAVATCLDRGAKAAVVWTIPYEMSRILGHLDPHRLHSMSEQEVGQLLARLPRKPRFMNAAPRTIKDLTRIVVEEFQGDATRIWQSRTASQVKGTFRRIHGVGPGIASMAVLLIERAFGILFSDRPSMDIKPDTHTCRVLYRLGVATNSSAATAIEAARWLSPGNPGEVDAPLWIIGRRWCRPRAPRCHECPLQEPCERQGLD